MYQFDNPPFDSNPIVFEDVVYPSVKAVFPTPKFDPKPIVYRQFAGDHDFKVGQVVYYDARGEIVPFMDRGHVAAGILVSIPDEDGSCFVQVAG